MSVSFGEIGKLNLQTCLQHSRLLLNRLAAIELNRKSQMISEAVEEVLNLVQDATQKFKSMMSTESEDLAQSNIHLLFTCFSFFCL